MPSWACWWRAPAERQAEAAETLVELLKERLTAHGLSGSGG
jgi:hypothetical protein